MCSALDAKSSSRENNEDVGPSWDPRGTHVGPTWQEKLPRFLGIRGISALLLVGMKDAGAYFANVRA